jgi:cell division protein FtsB|tara:strand:- start:1007 stop:1273 length:267 start_codon:yes stop_codon:yes gene_type:complete
VAVVFKKAVFDTVLASNMTIHLRILDNMVALLSERLNAANKQNDKLLRRIEDLEEEIEETEGSGNAPVEPPPARNDLADEHDEFPGED